MDKSAVVPQDNMVINIYGILKKEEEGTAERLKQDDELWSLFYKSEYFEMIDKFINNLCSKLDDLEGDAFENGASNDEIKSPILSIANAAAITPPNLVITKDSR